MIYTVVITIRMDLTDPDLLEASAHWAMQPMRISSTTVCNQNNNPSKMGLSQDTQVPAK